MHGMPAELADIFDFIIEYQYNDYPKGLKVPTQFHRNFGFTQGKFFIRNFSNLPSAFSVPVS